MSTEVLILGSIQIATLIVIVFYTVFTRSLAKATRILAEATQEEYLNPQILLSIRLYGRSGALNLVLENIGRGVAKEIRFSFPEGLFAASKDHPIDLTKYPIFSNTLATLVPGERHEICLGFLNKFKEFNIPTKFPYEIRYLSSADQPESISGVLDLQVYEQDLIPAYTNIEDLRKEIEEIRKLILEYLNLEKLGSRGEKNEI